MAHTHIELKDGLRKSPTSPKRGFTRKNSEGRSPAAGARALGDLKDQLRETPQRSHLRRTSSRSISNSPQRGLRRSSSNSPQRGVTRKSSGDKHNALKEGLLRVKTSPQRGLRRSGSGQGSEPNSPDKIKRPLSRPSLSRARSSFIEKPETQSHGFMVRVNSEAAGSTPVRVNSFKEKDLDDGEEEDENNKEKFLPEEQRKVLSEKVSNITLGLKEVASSNVDTISDCLILCESVIRSFGKRGLRRRSSTTDRTTSITAIRRTSLTAKPAAQIGDVVFPLVIKLLYDIKNKIPYILLEGCYPVPALPASETRQVIVFPKANTGRSHNIHAKTDKYVPKPKKGTIEFMKAEAAEAASHALHNYGIPEHRNSPIYVFNELRVAMQTVRIRSLSSPPTMNIYVLSLIICSFIRGCRVIGL